LAGKFVTVRVKGAGPLRAHVPDEELVLPAGSTLEEIVSRFAIPSGHPVLAMVDGKRRPLKEKLRDGSHVVLVTLLPGG
jgi:hypothetical protein